MDRLTFDGNFCDIAQCLEMRGGKHCPDGYCSQRRVWERLKEYEDAEKGGRLVVLPCKVGGTVYTTRWWDDVPEICTDSKGKKFERMATRHKVTKERFSPFGPDYIGFGKTVFLTREEADAALKKGESKDDVAD